MRLEYFQLIDRMVELNLVGRIEAAGEIAPVGPTSRLSSRAIPW
jgi:hypothetical protein